MGILGNRLVHGEPAASTVSSAMLAATLHKSGGISGPIARLVASVPSSSRAYHFQSIPDETCARPGCPVIRGIDRRNRRRVYCSDRCRIADYTRTGAILRHTRQGRPGRDNPRYHYNRPGEPRAICGARRLPGTATAAQAHGATCLRCLRIAGPVVGHSIELPTGVFGWRS